MHHNTSEVTTDVSAKSERSISIGFLNNYGYLSQMAQLGNHLSVEINDIQFNINLIRNVSTTIRDGRLQLDETNRPDILLAYKTYGAASSETYVEALDENIPVEFVTRYSKSTQQLRLNKFMRKSNVIHESVSVFRPLDVRAANALFIRSTGHTVGENNLTGWWVIKPEFGAQSKGIFIAKGSEVNIPMLLHKFHGPRSEELHKSNMRLMHLLHDDRNIFLPPGVKMSEIDFKQYYNGNMVAQEFKECQYEFRVIKFNKRKFDIYSRMKLNNDRYPYNDDIRYHFPLCTIDLDQSNPVEVHGLDRTPKDVVEVFKSANFYSMLEIFASDEMNFTVGSMDLWVNLNNPNNQSEFGIYEYQPQYGCMDIPHDRLRCYIETYFKRLIEKHLLGE